MESLRSYRVRERENDHHHHPVVCYLVRLSLGHTLTPYLADSTGEGMSPGTDKKTNRHYRRLILKLCSCFLRVTVSSLKESRDLLFLK